MAEYVLSRYFWAPCVKKNHIKKGGKTPRADKICQSGYKKHRYFFDDQSLQLFATHFDTATASGVVCPNRFSFYKKGFPALLRIALIGADVA